jgi:hypothetical protein
VKICYIDESGNLKGLPAMPTDDDQPVFAMTGLVFDSAELRNIVNEFLLLKQLFFPGLPYRSNQFLDCVLSEIKGAEIRKNLLRETRQKRRHARLFMGRVFSLIASHSGTIFSRIYVKALNRGMSHRSVYTAAMQGILENFDRYLASVNDVGICIADSRDFRQNVNASHSIFTRKYSAGSSNYSRIAELPVFGHSDNHVGLQLCDLVSSCIVYPIACQTYCAGTINNVHVQPRAVEVRQRFGPALQALQYRFYDTTRSRYRGGIVVSDSIGRRNASFMLS